ncbi:hypothetical protein [Paeniglutamicibacter gangotriensis]|uniref:hypothetical protein n=1 Tax=Paeniglutamicibacter gangotriensis TaxID=254787 RepID=UPI00165EBFCF|nr:hypothetical protein [Paeniglutamicibacter gangotriensis]
MKPDNNDLRDRKIKQDTRAWAKFTDTNYTTALRQIESPLAQGFLGEQVSARHLINTLSDHPLIGDDGGDFILGENGFYADTQWSFNGRSDFIELALLMDFLRMFTPIGPGETAEVSSYSLKHTAEKFLAPHCSYVTKGRLIWAAAALGLPVTEQNGGLNLMIGVSEREHSYVQRMVSSGMNKPLANHHRPAGFTHLKTALEQCAAGELVLGRWERPEPSTEVFPFHEWLMQQAGRDDVVGDLANDYAAGVQSSEHRIAQTPNVLLEILEELSAWSEVISSAEKAIIGWARVSLPSQRKDMSIRTASISDTKSATPGYDAGSGSIEIHEYLCPCGDGTVVEEHDNTPGFREHAHWIDCDKCREEWRFVPGLSVRAWRLEPKPHADASQQPA